ncbi:putative cytochrome P450 1A1-like [Apostichopus japonicus]|uniref:unspecific monooxygenase n=1 Tax=Stichopus japonicus TaxID=307972 RepID=A0A2G8L6Z1_STIJA|nr:putative cytochrome P450 1A1-like [Apostichopus japonicus]
MSSSSTTKQAKSVPGPRGLPILGNAHQLSNELHKTCAKLSNEYGDVFRIRIGSRDVVVLNGADAIRQALVRQSIDFAGRPDILSFRTYKKIIGENISFTSYSPGWKLHRKLAETALRTFTAGRQRSVLEEKVIFEVEELITFWTNNNNEEIVVDPANVIKLSVSNVMLSFIMGRRHELDNQKLLDFLSVSDDFAAATENGNPADFMPWLRYIAHGLVTKFENVLHSYKNWFGSYIEEHKRDFQVGSEEDILDYLCTATDGMNVNELAAAKITKETLQSTVYDLFGAGFDTVSSTLIWAVLYLITYPEIQERLYQELERNVGQNRNPNLDDRQNLPFTQAFLSETLRHSCVVPFTIPHATTRDVILGGKYNFRIPRDTVVFVNLHSVQHSKEVWDKPERFDPTRFLTEDGKELDQTKVEKTMAFGAGRRRCLGSELGRNELFLYVTNLVHKLSFSPYNKEELTMDYIPGLSVRPLPFKVRLTLRD